jgi:hypothetical protein
VQLKSITAIGMDMAISTDINSPRPAAPQRN